jgi:hypothetical protein
MSLLDEISKAAGTVTSVIRQAADTYDRITGGATPTTSTGGITQPPQTTGVDTTQGTTPSNSGGSSTLMIVGLAALVLLLAVRKG